MALKVLKPRYGTDPEFEHRFRMEAHVAAQLRHPNIVEIIDVGQADGLTWFAMPLAVESLDAMIARHGRLAEDTAVQVAREVAAGLAYAHQAGFVHRDIKPANVLLREGRAVIGDFGIARAVASYVSATGVSMTIGTPPYIAPEQAQGQPLDGRADLYALGVLMYKSLTGDVPFHSTDWFELARMHVEQQPEAPRKKRPHLSKQLERIVLRCLAKDPDDRYPSASAVRHALDALEHTKRSRRLWWR
jgi:serine/threonine-protein kinase